MSKLLLLPWHPFLGLSIFTYFMNFKGKFISPETSIKCLTIMVLMTKCNLHLLHVQYIGHCTLLKPWQLKVHTVGEEVKIDKIALFLIKIIKNGSLT